MKLLSINIIPLKVIRTGNYSSLSTRLAGLEASSEVVCDSAVRDVFNTAPCNKSDVSVIVFSVTRNLTLNLLQPTGHVMHHQFNIQQLYALPTLYLCVLYLSENKQRLVPLTA